jgi:predicted nucleic acid-binding protein
VILADTSIWIDHFRRGSPELARVISADQLLVHDAIIGELALGSIRDRAVVLDFLAKQRHIAAATHAEVMAMIATRGIHSMGIGYTDAHLLASALIEQGARLWTNDRRLSDAARNVGVALHIPDAPR